MQSLNVEWWPGHKSGKSSEGICICIPFKTNLKIFFSGKIDEKPAKKANKKNSFLCVKKYKIIEAVEKSHKCNGNPSFHSSIYPSLYKSMPWFIRSNEIITKTSPLLLLVLLSRNIFGRKIIIAIQKNVNIMCVRVNHRDVLVSEKLVLNGDFI
mgnify:CR=1 FL=1